MLKRKFDSVTAMTAKTETFCFSVVTGVDTPCVCKLLQKSRFAVISTFYTDKGSNGKLCHHDIADRAVDNAVMSLSLLSRGARHAYAHLERCIPRMILHTIYATTLADSRSASRIRHIGGRQSICALALGNRTLSFS